MRVVRRSPAAHRNRGRLRAHVPVLAAGSVEIALVLVSLGMLVDWPERVGWIAAGGVVAFAVLLATARASAVGMATNVLRLVGRVVGLTALAVTATFVLVIGATGLPEPDDRRIVGWSLAAAVVVACLAPAVHRWLADRIDDLVGTGTGSSVAQLDAFGARLTRATPMDELLLQLVETVAQTFARRRVDLWLLSGDTLTWTTGVPHRRPATVTLGERERSTIALAGISGSAWAGVWLPVLGTDAEPDRVRYAPLVHRGQLLGLLVVERPTDEPPFRDDDDRALDQLARQVAIALHNVRLDTALQESVDQLRRRNVELQESRARIVTAADAERRRLERDLHDGAQQHLTGLSVKVELAEALSATDPEQARALLAEIRDDLQSTKDQLRRLAHGIFPPLLTIGGLRDALPAVASRAPLPVTVDVNGMGRHGIETEAAVYFCCLEAIENAGKYAGSGARATIRAWEADDALFFEVADDGAGFDVDDAIGGHGLVNMADRIGALGGELAVVAAPGTGTTVSGRVPLTTPTAQGSLADR